MFEVDKEKDTDTEIRELRPAMPMDHHDQARGTTAVSTVGAVSRRGAALPTLTS